jgi:methylglutaconyl-CoA hydratase
MLLGGDGGATHYLSFGTWDMDLSALLNEHAFIMAVEKLAGELTSSNPEAMKELKQIMWQSTGHWDSTLEQRAEISGRLVLSEFTRKYIEAFRKK